MSGLTAFDMVAALLLAVWAARDVRWWLAGKVFTDRVWLNAIRAGAAAFLFVHAALSWQLGQQADWMLFYGALAWLALDQALHFRLEWRIARGDFS